MHDSTDVNWCFFLSIWRCLFWYKRICEPIAVSYNWCLANSLHSAEHSPLPIVIHFSILNSSENQCRYVPLGTISSLQYRRRLRCVLLAFALCGCPACTHAHTRTHGTCSCAQRAVGASALIDFFNAFTLLAAGKAVGLGSGLRMRLITIVLKISLFSRQRKGLTWQIWYLVSTSWIHFPNRVGV